MDISLFSYEYPDELVAQRPLAERHGSRMMVLDRKEKRTSHSRAIDLPSFLKSGDLIVINDSRVVPARIFGTRESKEGLEVLVVERACASVWRCLLKRPGKIKRGERISFGERSHAIAQDREEIYLLMDFPADSLEHAIQDRGVPPLPPYIKRSGYEAYTDEDRERYQTVYASEPGSAAAPTAGLHLSRSLIDSMKARGVEIVNVTLHVGIDTFAPVRENDVLDHKMHGERVIVSEDAARAILRAKDEKRRVIAIGTTTARALESAFQRGKMRAGSWTTELYILPGYDFKAVDAMLTNFHQPRSTLLAMVCAFAGRDFVLAGYSEAIKERYRLFSYGDCMLII